MTPEQDALVLKHMGVAHKVVSGFLASGVPRNLADELTGEAMLLLVVAAKNYDPDRAKFTTHSYNTIHNGLVDWIRKNDSSKPNTHPKGAVKPDANPQFDKLKDAIQMPKHGLMAKRHMAKKYYEEHPRPYSLDVPAICRGLLAHGSPVLW